MRALAVVIAAVALLFSAHAEEKAKPPRKKSVPIGSWLLTATKHEKTKTEGKRTLLLTATGEATLKRSSKKVRAVVDVTAKAERIECDFVEKVFVLRGDPQFREVNPETKALVRELTGEGGAVIRVPFQLGEEGKKVETTGEITTKAGE